MSALRCIPAKIRLSTSSAKGPEWFIRRPAIDGFVTSLALWPVYSGEHIRQYLRCKHEDRQPGAKSDCLYWEVWIPWRMARLIDGQHIGRAQAANPIRRIQFRLKRRLGVRSEGKFDWIIGRNLPVSTKPGCDRTRSFQRPKLDRRRGICSLIRSLRFVFLCNERPTELNVRGVFPKWYARVGLNWEHRTSDRDWDS